MASNARRSRKTYKAPTRRDQRKMGYPTGNKIRKPSHDKSNKTAAVRSYLCPVPKGECVGKFNVKDFTRSHSTPEQVLSCEHQWLTKNGFKKITARTFENPETGRIMLLNKRPVRTKRGKANVAMGRQARVVCW